MDDNLRLLLDLTKNLPPPDDFHPTNYDAKALLDAYRKRLGVEPGAPLADSTAMEKAPPKQKD